MSKSIRAGLKRKSFFLAACTIFGLSNAEATGSIKDWLAKNTNQGEVLLCEREVEGEYFFLTRSNEKFKIGSRLNMSGHTSTQAFLTGWQFQNENGKSLSTKVPPLRVKNEYVKVNEAVFAENIQYQTLNLQGSKVMVVSVYIRKCSASGCDPLKKKSKDDKEYSLKLCEISLN